MNRYAILMSEVFLIRIAAKIAVFLLEKLLATFSLLFFPEKEEQLFEIAVLCVCVRVCVRVGEGGSESV